MSAIERNNVTTRYADSVVYNKIIYMVEVPSSNASDITTQTAEIFKSLDKQLTALGSGPDRLLSATVYVTDMTEIAAFNTLWEHWIPAGHAPSRAAVQVSRLADPNWKVELVITAAC